MKAPIHAALVAATCIFLAGCAGSGARPGTSATAALSGTVTLPTRAIANTIAIGKSTKADVIAALGKTTVVSFDSGFEVWVYQVKSEQITAETASAAGPNQRGDLFGRGKDAPGNSEFVVLFNPAGVVAKTRLRPAPPVATRK